MKERTSLTNAVKGLLKLHGKRGLFGRLPASGPALLEPVAVCVHLQDVDMVGDAVEQRAGETLAGEHRRPFLEGLSQDVV